MEIRRLEASDRLVTFSCGNASLDAWVRQHALQNMTRLFVGVTYVCVANADLCGFVTVCAAAIPRDELRARGGYPTSSPVLLLARMGVAVGAQRSGVGKLMIRYVLSLSLEMADRFGCVGVVVDAKHGVEGYYGQFGFEEIRRDEHTSKMILGLDVIREVAAGSAQA